MPIDPHSLDSEGWQRGTVTWRREWPGSKGLVSLRLSEQVQPRRAGQYIKLACQNKEGAWGVRYLSLASPPDAPPELLVAPVSGDREPGNPAGLKVGDRVVFSRVGAGKLTVPSEGGKTLWLLAAGTGLAPLLAVCRAGNPGFEQVVVVHSARHATELAWRDELTGRAAEGELRYVPVVTRGREEGASDDPRIPALIERGELDERAGVSLDPAADVVLICGSGAMNGDTRAALEARGMPSERVITEF